MGSRIKITYRKSMIGSSEKHRRTLRALGLWTLGQSVTRADSPSLRGMLRRVAHLVKVEELGDEAVEVPGPHALAAPAVAPQETPARRPRRRRAEEVQQPTDEPPAEEAAAPTSRRRKTVRKQAAEDTAPAAPTSPAPAKRKRTRPADEAAADESTGGVPGGKTS